MTTNWYKFRKARGPVFESQRAHFYIMYKLPNYLEDLAINTNRCRLCLDNQNKLIKNICDGSNIQIISKNLDVSERLVYYWLKKERPVSIVNLIKLNKLSKAYKTARYISINGVKQKTKLCKRLTPKLAYLVGYIFGDGHIGRYNFQITDSSKQNIKIANKLLKEIFGLNAEYRFRKDRNYYFINKSWKIGVLFLNKVFGMPIGSKNGKLSIPKLIKKADIKIQKMFILGFLAADFGGNSLTQTSYDILKDTSQVLKKLKIKHKINGPYGPYRGNEVKKWIISFNKTAQYKINKELSEVMKIFG